MQLEIIPCLISAKAVRAVGRRTFVGSDARIIMGSDEAALLRLWQEKRGEVEPKDLSGNLIVQLGVVTDPLNRHWFKRNRERRALRSARKRLFLIFDRKALSGGELQALTVSPMNSERRPLEDFAMRSGRRMARASRATFVFGAAACKIGRLRRSHSLR